MVTAIDVDSTAKLFGFTIRNGTDTWVEVDFFDEVYFSFVGGGM